MMSLSFGSSLSRNVHDHVVENWINISLLDNFIVVVVTAAVDVVVTVPACVFSGALMINTNTRESVTAKIVRVISVQQMTTQRWRQLCPTVELNANSP